MISPELMVGAILVYMIVSGVLNILGGALKSEKSTHYGMINIVSGIIYMIIAFILFLI